MKGQARHALVTVAFIGAIAILVISFAAQAKEPPAEEGATEKPLPLMHQKLEAMQGALHGIATNDFRRIRESGDLLQRISLIDQWLKYEDPAYGQMTEDFRRGVEQMIMAADVENLEGATLYYQKVTTSCLECHTFMRDSGRH